MSGSYTPTVAGFLDFIRNQMEITPAQLPDTSPAISFAFTVATATVNLVWAQISPITYMLCVYNLAADRLVNYAQDQPGQTFFNDLRKAWNVLGFIPGIVASTADQSTSESLLLPAFMQQLTLADLQNLKTPYGREYLGLAQNFGPMWGIS